MVETFMTIIDFKEKYPFKKNFDDNSAYLKSDSDGYWSIEEIEEIKNKIVKAKNDEEIREICFWTNPYLFPYIIKLLADEINKKD